MTKTTPEDDYIETIRTEIVRVAYFAKQIEKSLATIFKLSEVHYRGKDEFEAVQTHKDDSGVDPVG